MNATTTARRAGRIMNITRTKGMNPKSAMGTIGVIGEHLAHDPLPCPDRQRRQASSAPVVSSTNRCPFVPGAKGKNFGASTPALPIPSASIVYKMS